MLTEAQLRAILQLPPRPASETILYNGSTYYDLSHFEALSIFSLTGSTSSNGNYNFVNGTDYNLTYGVIGFGGGAYPVVGSVFKVDYSYSALGEDTVSTSMFIASTTVLQQLASTFPYNQITAAGAAYNDLATLGMMMVAARECAASLAAGENANAIKYRRGGVQMDETAKTINWMKIRDDWDAKYERYLKIIRPAGRPSVLATIAAECSTLVFSSDGYTPEQWAYLHAGEYGTYGGTL